MTIEQELAQAKARIAELEPQLSTVTAQRDVAQEQAKKNFAALTEATEAFKAADKLSAEMLLQVTGERDDAKAEAKQAKESADKRANVLAQEALAKSGHPAMNLGGEGVPAAAAKPNPAEGLTGLEKAIAAHKAKAKY